MQTAIAQMSFWPPLLSVADLLTMSHLLTICSYTINSSSNHSIFFLVFFFWSRAPFYDFSMICLSWWGVEKGVKRGQNDEKRHICHSNHHSIKSWHRFNLKEFMDNHRHLNLPYTNLQEDLRQDRVRRDILSIGGANSLNPSGTMNKFRLGSLKLHRDSQWVITGSEKEPMWWEWPFGVLKIMQDILSMSATYSSLFALVVLFI